MHTVFDVRISGQPVKAILGIVSGSAHRTTHSNTLLHLFCTLSFLVQRQHQHIHDTHTKPEKEKAQLERIKIMPSCTCYAFLGWKESILGRA